MPVVLNATVWIDALQSYVIKDDNYGGFSNSPTETGLTLEKIHKERRLSNCVPIYHTRQGITTTPPWERSEMCLGNHLWLGYVTSVIGWAGFWVDIILGGV